MNPILYQVLSRKFRIAFRDTFGGCLPCLRTTLPEITYSNIVGGASSYKLSRTGSFYSNGSFRRSSFNFDPAVVPPTPVHKTAEDHFLTMDTTTSTANNRTQSEPSSARLLVIPNTTGNGNGNGNDRDSDSRSLASGRSTNSLQVTLGPSNSFLSVPAFKF